jgi:hypothetical protein
MGTFTLVLKADQILNILKLIPAHRQSTRLFMMRNQ